MKPRTPDNLIKLVDAQCNGQSDDAAVEQLDNWLREDTEAVNTYVDYKDMHASLQWVTAPDEAEVTADDREKAVAGMIHVSPWSRVAQGINLFSLFALAASILLVWMTFANKPALDSTASSSQIAKSQANEEPTEAEQADRVARITGLVDCQWEEGQTAFQFGSVVTPGEQVELAAGLLQLTFDSGAKVIVQGPARFVPMSSMQARLERGKLSAVVSESARGYTVMTPSAEVVDLGTEFALDVRDDGATELHVLEGEVVARQRSVGGEPHGEAIQASKLEALRFDLQVGKAERITADPGRFARQITPKLTAEELPPLPVTDSLKFWVAADLLVSRRQGYVSAWRDVCIGDNQMSNDACQFDEEAQPLWVPDAGFGRPAIRFNGKSTRLTTDEFSTGNQVTIYVACVPSDKGQINKVHGGQLLNFGGQAPTIEMSLSHDHYIYSGLWAANAFGKEITTGVLFDQQFVPGQPQVFCYRYDLDNNQAELWVNGHSSGFVPAPLKPKTTSSRTIGGHGKEENVYRFYRGDIYEVLIYDSALEEEQREAVIEYLKDRYQSDGQAQASL
ncbi:MAG: FecR domain-containing protein [Lacipirellulaceae bacterium]